MNYQIVDIKGKETGNKISLDKNIFGIESNEHVVYLAIKQYMANNRQGTHKSKQRSEIIGSTRKIKKQKGTGTARAGSIKSPLFRGGGRAFGPNPRNYSFKLNKKVKKLAKKYAPRIGLDELERIWNSKQRLSARYPNSDAMTRSTLVPKFGRDITIEEKNRPSMIAPGKCYCCCCNDENDEYDRA